MKRGRLDGETLIVYPVYCQRCPRLVGYSDQRPPAVIIFCPEHVEEVVP